MNFFEAMLTRFGEDPQIDVMIEEMSELTKGLLKYRRKRNFPDYKPETYLAEYRTRIREEMADVLIMLKQMQQLFGPDLCFDEFLRKLAEKQEFFKDKLKDTWDGYT